MLLAPIIKESVGEHTKRWKTLPARATFARGSMAKSAIFRIRRRAAKETHDRSGYRSLQSADDLAQRLAESFETRAGAQAAPPCFQHG